MTEAMQPCCFCGMPCAANEYHPYAACLMFKACHDSETVRTNLEAVRGTPAVAKWAPEEIADGERGIRWVTNEGIHGRPTDHDVREYLKQTPTAHGCHCDECKQFYTTPQPTQAQAEAVPLTDDQIQDLLLCGNPTDEEMRLIRIGWDAANGIKGGQHGTE